MDELTQRGQKEKGKRSKYPGRSKEKRKAHGRKLFSEGGWRTHGRRGGFDLSDKLIWGYYLGVDLSMHVELLGWWLFMQCQLRYHVLVGEVDSREREPFKRGGQGSATVSVPFSKSCYSYKQSCDYSYSWVTPLENTCCSCLIPKYKKNPLMQI